MSKCTVPSKRTKHKNLCEKKPIFCCPLEGHCLTEQDSHPDPDLDVHQNPLAVSIWDPYQNVTDPEHCIECSKRKYTGSTQMATGRRIF